MNPFHLDATGLMIWGLVAHLIADWPLQNDWMANNKMKRRKKLAANTLSTFHDSWWDRHPAAYIHAGIHWAFLSFVFGWVAFPLAAVHLVIDCRWVVAKWSQLIKQTQPEVNVASLAQLDKIGTNEWMTKEVVLYDIGTEVRFWTDQVFHIITIAIAALVVSVV